MHIALWKRIQLQLTFVSLFLPLLWGFVFAVWCRANLLRWVRLVVTSWGLCSTLSVRGSNDHVCECGHSHHYC